VTVFFTSIFVFFFVSVYQKQLGADARKVVGPDGRVCTSLVESAETVMRKAPEPVKERHLEDSIASVLQLTGF